VKDLSPRAREVVDAAKAAEGPSAADKARVWAGLEARLNDPREPELPEAVDAPTTGGSARAAKWGAWAAAGAAVAVGVLIGTTSPTRDGARLDPAPPPARRSPAFAQRHFVQPPSPAPSRGAPTASPAAPPTAPERNEGGESTPGPSARTEGSPGSAAGGAATDRGSPGPGGRAEVDGAASDQSPAARLAAEAALVRAIQAALRDDQPDRALALAGAHRARFPEGALEEERLAAEIVAACALDDVRRAAEARRALERRYPESVHRDRIEAACGADRQGPAD